MNSFIDISHVGISSEQPYIIVVFEDGAIRDMSEHAELANVVAFCKSHHLPIVSDNAELRVELANYDIAVHPFDFRAVGE